MNSVHLTLDFIWWQIPLSDFVVTNQGDLVQHQVKMMREKVRTIGVSILGGKSKVQGRYELGIESIRAVNEVSTHSASSVSFIQLAMLASRNQSPLPTLSPPAELFPAFVPLLAYNLCVRHTCTTVTASN